MGTIFGALGLQDTDYAYINTLGQSVVYEATEQLLGDHNADLEAALAVFVEGSTWDHVQRYKLPGSGELDRVGRLSRTAAAKAANSWDTAFPLEEFGRTIAGDRVSLAYMNLQQYQLHLDTVMIQDRNTVRKEMLRAIFNPTTRPFQDENWGVLNIQPLANGDGTMYPPRLGSIDDTGENNYLAFAPATITDVNNPIPTLVNQLEQHFGAPTGGSMIVVFCNNAQTAQLQSLSNFDPVPNRFVEYGENVSLVPEDKFPAGMPGRTLGESDSALLVEWRWIPANYLVAIHLEAPQPLKRRIDPPATGLGVGLQLVAQDIEHPFRSAEWSHRFGFGVGNRLNGVVMQLGQAGAYAAPAIYNY